MRIPDLKFMGSEVYYVDILSGFLNMYTRFELELLDFANLYMY